MNELVKQMIAKGLADAVRMAEEFDKEHTDTKERISSFRDDMEKRSKSFSERQAKRMGR